MDFERILAIQRAMLVEQHAVAKCGCRENNYHPMGNKCKQCGIYADRDPKSVSEVEYSKLIMDRLWIDVPNR